MIDNVVQWARLSQSRILGVLSLLNKMYAYHDAYIALA